MNEKEYLVSLYAFLPLGPLRTKLLIKYFGSAKKVWYATGNKLIEVGLNPKIVHSFDKFRRNFNGSGYFKRVNELGVKILTINEKEYPGNLRDLENAPLVLYVRGNLPDFTGRAIAMVGSRKMSSYGKEVAHKLGSELANLGVIIVSGLAFGIDTVSHLAALEVKGLTVAVLASGVDVITPSSNIYVAKKILGSGGAIISEYPLGTLPLRTYFPNRNRIIAGLSNGVLVVEGTQKSGTFHTVNSAANYGRQVFAVPGPIYSPASEFPNYLIKNGAKMITSSKDVAEELHLGMVMNLDDKPGTPADNKKEKKLLEILSEPLHLDEIVRISTLKVADISATLTVMELKGLVKNLGGGIYKKY